MENELFDVGNITISIFYYLEDSTFVNEAKSRGNYLVGNYSYIKHPAHTTPGHYHLHVYDGSNQIFAINKNGTAHDGYHGVKIPNRVYAALKQKFPNWSFPDDKIIESIHYTYFFKEVSDLEFTEIQNEIEEINRELNLFNDYEKMPKSLLTDRYEEIKSHEDKFTRRFQDLQLESFGRKESLI